MSIGLPTAPLRRYNPGVMPSFAIVKRFDTRRVTIYSIDTATRKLIRTDPKGAAAAVDLPGGVYQLRYWADGAYRYYTFDGHVPVDMGALIKLYHKLISTRTQPRLPDLIRSYLLDLRRRHHFEAEKQTQYALADFTIATIPTLPRGPIIGAAITRDHILAYHEVLREKELSERTIRNRHVLVTAFLRWSKLLPVDMPKAPRHERRLPQVATDDQINQLLDWSRNHDRYSHVLIELARRTGLRKRELMHATWSNVLWSDGVYRLTENPAMRYTIKTRAQREIPLDNELLDILRDWQRSRQRSTFILGTRTDKPNHSLLQRLKHASRKANVNTADVSLHMLRRAFVSRLLASNVPVRDVQAMAGHGSIATTQLYARPQTTAAMRDQINRVRW